ncbi:hypothetical protein QJQ45_022225 [Haematococcus lacustris]|nr:hypothetical protein QJQ45_022225 [Haematococcus lacustris]
MHATAGSTNWATQQHRKPSATCLSPFFVSQRVASLVPSCATSQSICHRRRGSSSSLVFDIEVEDHELATPVAQLPQHLVAAVAPTPDHEQHLADNGFMVWIRQGMPPATASKNNGSSPSQASTPHSGPTSLQGGSGLGLGISQHRFLVVAFPAADDLSDVTAQITPVLPKASLSSRDSEPIWSATAEPTFPTSDNQLPTGLRMAVVDPNYKQLFRVGASGSRSREYADLLDLLPDTFVGGAHQLATLVRLLVAEVSMKQFGGAMDKVFGEKGLPVPPWRTYNAMASHWLVTNASDTRVYPSAPPS